MFCFITRAFLLLTLNKKKRGKTQIKLFVYSLNFYYKIDQGKKIHTHKTKTNLFCNIKQDF